MAKKRTSKEWSDIYQTIYQADQSGGGSNKLTPLLSLQNKKVLITNSLNPSQSQELTIKEVGREFDLNANRTLLKVRTELGIIDLRIPQKVIVDGNLIILDYSRKKDSHYDWTGQQKMRKSGGRKYTKVSNEDDLVITIELLEEEQEKE